MTGLASCLWLWLWLWLCLWPGQLAVAVAVAVSWPAGCGQGGWDNSWDNRTVSPCLVEARSPPTARTHHYSTTTAAPCRSDTGRNTLQTDGLATALHGLRCTMY